MAQPECKNPAIFEELNRLIYEVSPNHSPPHQLMYPNPDYVFLFQYLELNGMEKTVSSFATECESKSLPCPPTRPESGTKATFTQYDATNLLKCFEEGDLDGFIKVKHFKHFPFRMLTIITLLALILF
jgi:hypothetical protein